MLKTRVIPTLLWKDPGLVKGVAFDSWRRVGTVLPAIRVYNLRDVDEIIIVDITATGEQRRPDVESVRDFSQDCFVPLTVGGGIGSLEDIRELLRAGADKVSLNSALFERPELIASAAEHFGTQCIVASLDCRRLQGRTLCFSHSGTRNTEREVVEVARQAQQLGAGEILLTSIERDGTMEGYDLELVRQVAEAVDEEERPKRRRVSGDTEPPGAATVQ